VARLSGKMPVPTVQAAPVELPNPNDIDVEVKKPTKQTVVSQPA
jgi:hypothetical protein